jgi:hypothetical protein
MLKRILQVYNIIKDKTSFRLAQIYLNTQKLFLNMLIIANYIK